MKINNNILLIGGAAIAAGAYLVYKKTKENKDLLNSELDAAQKAVIDAETKAAAAKQAAINAQKEKANSLENPNSNASKVAKVQLYLGVNPDGKVGANTLKALVAKFNNFTTITSSNVDAILAEIDARKKSASDLSQKQTSTSALQAKVAFAKRLETLTSDGSHYAVLLNNVSAPAYAFDSLTNSYRYLGNKKSFFKGNQFVSNLVSRGNGEILIKDGSTRYSVDPNNFIVKAK
jgi:LPXTG-motif cell wall-anchored protein